MEYHRQLTHRFILTDMNLVYWHDVVKKDENNRADREQFNNLSL
jgi:hypothetical protein